MRTKKQAERTPLYNLWCVSGQRLPGRHSAGWSSGLHSVAGICACVIVAWLLTYTNAMKINVGCNRDGTEKQEEFECGHPFPCWCNVLPLVDGQKTEQQTERHNEGERSKANLLMGGVVYVSWADLGLGCRTTCNLVTCGGE